MYRMINLWTITFKSSTQSGTKYLSAVTDRLTVTAYWRVCTRCMLKRRKNWNICCKSTLRRRHSATTSMMITDWSCWSKDMSSRKSRVLNIHSEMSRREHTCNRSSEQKYSEKITQKKSKTTPEESASVGSQKAMFIWHALLKHDQNKKGKGRGRLRSLSPTHSLHQNSKCDGKGSDDRRAEGTQRVAGKKQSGKRRDDLVQAAKTRSCQRRNSCNYWHVPERTKFKAPGGCKFGDKCAYKRTAKLADEKRNSASIAVYIPSNDEPQMQQRKTQSDDRTQHRVRLHHLANKYFLKGRNWDLHLESPRLDLKIRKIQTLQHSRKGLSNGLWAWKKKKTSAWILHKNVYKIPGSCSENRHRFFKPSPASNVFFSILEYVEGEWAASLHVISKMCMWLQKNRKRFKSRRVHQLVGLQMELLIDLKKQQYTSVICHVHSSSTVERILCGTFGMQVVRRKWLLVWMVPMWATISHQEDRNK